MTPDPGTLLEDRSWVYELGANAQVQEDIEDYGLVQSIRVLYGAIEAEFGITEEAWADPPIDRETACVICNGLRVLHDPEGRLDRAIILARAYGNSTG